ncbi:alpha/beta fold hydrolase [Xanthobacter sp. V4C-4]|uniref:thioesterase II family protein n=1 Tax=Xanthobacter cornucopiae TaxID=3119924 RepID=UPI0037269BCF
MPPPRLVLLPHAGGAAGALPWRALLPRDWAERVIDLELPGRGRRFGVPFAASLRSLAEELAASIHAVSGAEPVLLQGHSMGALIAYETARALLDRGVAVAGLVLSGRAAPHWPAVGAGRPRHLRSDAELVAELRRLGGTPAAVLAEPDLLELMLPVLRADFKLVETYRWVPGPALPLPAVVVGGVDDPATPPESLAAWGEALRGPVRVERWAGGHFFAHHAPRRYAELIQRHAEAVAAAAAGGPA